jgi:hypothetical protein
MADTSLSIVIFHAGLRGKYGDLTSIVIDQPAFDWIHETLPLVFF